MKDLKTHFEENENLEEKFKRDALYSNLLDKDLKLRNVHLSFYCESELNV